jgi:hypothetical protein
MTAPATVIAFGIRPVLHAHPEAPGRSGPVDARYDPRVPDAFDTGPGPRRIAFLLAYGAVILGGLLGAALGYGITDTGCHGNCGSSTAIGTIIGALIGAIGTGIVAVLALRAMAEWRRPPR